jgi:integrase/recombinase XerD
MLFQQCNSKGESMAERKRELRVPTTEEVETLLRSFSTAPTSVRNRALVALLWRCGLRITEALSLTPGDLDRARGRLHVRRGKGSKQRMVGLDAGAIALVDAWLAVRPKTTRTAPLFVTLKGDPVSASYVRSMLIRKSRKLGLPQLHPHCLRHAFAVGLTREGASMRTVQSSLGHGDLTTTAVYLASLGEDEAAEAVAARQWSLT